MKIKKVLLSCLMLAGALSVSAQEAKTEYVHNPYWYIQVQGGAQYTLGEIDFKDLISPNVQVTVGRQSLLYSVLVWPLTHGRVRPVLRVLTMNAINGNGSMLLLAST